MTSHLEIYWTQSLQAAAKAVAQEPADDYANTHDVRHRAHQAYTYCTPGIVLTAIQLDQLQQLRSRLDCRSVEPLQSHRDFEAAWSGAYAEAQDAHADKVRNEVSDAMNSSITELEACDLDDEIFAWPYGLGVGFTKDGKPYAASLDKAVTAAQVLWPVRNGANVEAVRMRRQDAIRAQLADLRRIMGEYLERSA